MHHGSQDEEIRCFDFTSVIGAIFWSDIWSDNKVFKFSNFHLHRNSAYHPSIHLINYFRLGSLLRDYLNKQNQGNSCCFEVLNFFCIKYEIVDNVNNIRNNNYKISRVKTTLFVLQFKILFISIHTCFHFST